MLHGRRPHPRRLHEAEIRTRREGNEVPRAIERVVLAQSRQDRRLGIRGNADAVRLQVLAYIRAHLDDLELSHNQVAAVHHIAPRTLSRLFEDEPSSVTAYIRTCRLQAVRRDLGDPLMGQRSIAAIAARWCFTDQAHFTRAYRAEFGVTPSASRRTFLGGPADPPPPAAIR